MKHNSGVIRLHLSDQCILIKNNFYLEVTNKNLFRSIMTAKLKILRILDLEKLFNTSIVRCVFCENYWREGSSFVFNGYRNRWFDCEPSELFENETSNTSES